MYGSRSVYHTYHCKPTSTYTPAAPQIGSAGRMGCFQRAFIPFFHFRRLPTLLDSLLCFLLCKYNLAEVYIRPNTSHKIQVYATEKLGFDETSGANLIIIINAAGLPIRAPLGYIADRFIGPLNCLIPWVALCAILIYSWAAVYNSAGLYVFAVFYGIASAAAMGLFAGTVPSLTKDMNKIGTRVGMVLTLMSFGPLTGPSVAGALISDSNGNYLSAQIWAGSALLVATASLLTARMWTSGWHLMVKL